jgi:hypothetical protein
LELKRRSAVADRPKQVADHKELVAMKRSLAACDKLRRMFNKLGLAIFLATAACAANVTAAAPAREITLTEAQALVTAAVQGPGTKMLQGFGVEHLENDDSPAFFFLSALWSPPADFQGSVVVGNFAVDKRTGDVWSAVYCHEESSRYLRSRQALLRKQLGMSESAYRHNRRHGPLCD